MKANYYGKDYEWDEEAIAENHNIRNKRFCFKHDWINASLRFEITTPKTSTNESGCYYISLECWGHETPFPVSGWGFGYGGIRFCKNCKDIDCIHLWEPEEPKDESWKNCLHEWHCHGLTGYQCCKCGADYSWMCGCGGSMYVCSNHYDEHLKMVKNGGGIVNFLKTRAFAPRLPHIRTCKICRRRVKIF